MTAIIMMMMITYTDHLQHSRTFPPINTIAPPVLHLTRGEEVREECCSGQCPALDEPSINIRCECGDEEGRAQGGEIQLREGNSLAQGHPAGKRQSWDGGPGGLAPHSAPDHS